MEPLVRYKVEQYIRYMQFVKKDASSVSTALPHFIGYLQGLLDCEKITQDEFAEYKSRAISLFINQAVRNGETHDKIMAGEC